MCLRFFSVYIFCGDHYCSFLLHFSLNQIRQKIIVCMGKMFDEFVNTFFSHFLGFFLRQALDNKVEKRLHFDLIILILQKCVLYTHMRNHLKKETFVIILIQLYFFFDKRVEKKVARE